jgi:hypothetical protein
MTVVLRYTSNPTLRAVATNATLLGLHMHSASPPDRTMWTVTAPTAALANPRRRYGAAVSTPMSPTWSSVMALRWAYATDTTRSSSTTPYTMPLGMHWGNSGLGVLAHRQE